MGRPRIHDERTAAALLDVAERIVTEDGLAALSVRRLAAEVGTTTRAVYSLFGSKDGLVIALGARAFNLLRDGLTSLRTTDDPAGDLVEAGVAVFRSFTLGHAALFSIGFLQTGVTSEINREFGAAQENALACLYARIERLKNERLLGTRTVPDATLEFHALCEGLAALEGRNILRAEEAERIWRDALSSLVSGWGASG